MAYAPCRGTRLAVLIRNFGLCPVEFISSANNEQKQMMTSLRAEYRRLAKENHPDMAPADQKEQASDKFVKLKNDFEEAHKLLESGIRPVGASTSGPSATRWQATSAGSAAAGGGPMGNVWYEPAPHWQEKQWEKSKPPEFDFATKMKGRFVVGSGLILFVYFMREFGAAFAGSTFAWHPGTGTRRYGGQQESAAAVRQEAADKPKVKPQVVPERKPVDSFYTKRGISGTKKNWQPRGYGPSL